MRWVVLLGWFFVLFWGDRPTHIGPFRDQPDCEQKRSEYGGAFNRLSLSCWWDGKP